MTLKASNKETPPPPPFNVDFAEEKFIYTDNNVQMTSTTKAIIGTFIAFLGLSLILMAYIFCSKPKAKTVVKIKIKPYKY